MIRKDTFAVGDKVVWANKVYANLTSGQDRFGAGPFVIKKVIDQPDGLWDSMGHTQHVFLEGMTAPFSGAFFRKEGEPEIVE